MRPRWKCEEGSVKDLGAMETGIGAEAYAFGPRDYARFMTYDLTDRHRGRRHLCPLCGATVWSCWGHADRHWQGHGETYGSREGAS